MECIINKTLNNHTLKNKPLAVVARYLALKHQISASTEVLEYRLKKLQQTRLTMAA